MKALLALGFASAGLLFTSCESTTLVDRGPSRRVGYYDDRPGYHRSYATVHRGDRYDRYDRDDRYYGRSYRTTPAYYNDRTTVRERNVYRTDVNRTNVNRTTINRVDDDRRRSVERTSSNRQNVIYSERPGSSKVKVKNRTRTNDEDDRRDNREDVRIRVGT